MIWDKPFASTVENAEALVRLLAETGLPLIITQICTGFPMVREAPALNAAR